MSVPGSGADLPIACLGEIPPGKSKKFTLNVGRFEVPCFVVHWRGAYYTYVNKCRHVTTEMDWVENRFFDEDGELILCSNHGDCYGQDTGECIGGPAYGKSLIAVPLEVRGDEILAGVPDDFEDVL